MPTSPVYWIACGSGRRSLTRQPCRLPSNLKILSQSRLVNLINLRNFLGKEIFLVFNHPRFNQTHFIPVNPSPGTDDRLVCTWSEGRDLRGGLGPFRLACLLFDEGSSCVIAPAEEIQFENKEIIIRLPRVGFEVLSRKRRRYPCRSITASLMQDGFLCQGGVDEFSTNTFRVVIPESEFPQWKWINIGKPLNILSEKPGRRDRLFGLGSSIERTRPTAGAPGNPQSEGEWFPEDKKQRNPYRAIHLNAVPECYFPPSPDSKDGEVAHPGCFDYRVFTGSARGGNRQPDSRIDYHGDEY